MRILQIAVTVALLALVGVVNATTIDSSSPSVVSGAAIAPASVAATGQIKSTMNPATTAATDSTFLADPAACATNELLMTVAVADTRVASIDCEGDYVGVKGDFSGALTASSTLDVTGVQTNATYINMAGNNVRFTSGGSFMNAGITTASGNVGICQPAAAGTACTTADAYVHFSSSGSTVLNADTGQSVKHAINNAVITTTSSTGLAVTGVISATGKASITANSGTCTLNGGTPATCTVTVTAGAVCLCSDVGTTAAVAAGGCSVSLSGTTLTVTGAVAANNNVNVLCDR